MVCVAGNSIESPRLLLMSASSLHPDGLANSSGQVGRNYMRHMTGSAYATFEQPVRMYRGETMAGIIADEAKHDTSRGFAGGYYMETLSLGPAFLAAFVEPGEWGRSFTEKMDAYERTAGMWIVGEDMPQESNRITLNTDVKDQHGLPVPNVHFDDHPNDVAMREHGYASGGPALRGGRGAERAPHPAVPVDAQPRHLPDERAAGGRRRRPVGQGARRAEPVRQRRLGDDDGGGGEPDADDRRAGDAAGRPHPAGDERRQPQLKAGRTWWDQILEQIRTVDVVVLVVSRGYVTAEACRAEWKYAFAVKRGVLPVVIDSIRYDELPMEVAALQVVRRGDREKIATAVDDLVARPLPNSLPANPSPPLTWPKIVDVVRSEESVDGETHVAVAAKLIEHLWPTGTKKPPFDVHKLITEFRDRKDLDPRARRIIDAVLPRPRHRLPVIGSILGGLALTHLFWATGLYELINQEIGRARGPILVNLVLAVVGALLCLAAWRNRVYGARLGLSLCALGFLAVVIDAEKILWIDLVPWWPA